MVFISSTRKLRLQSLIKSRINRHNQILQYSEREDRLVLYYWWVHLFLCRWRHLIYFHVRPRYEVGSGHRGARIPPDQLHDLQGTYDYALPTCFCGRETVICVSTAPLKKFRNEFIAKCERGACEYLGAYFFDKVSYHIMIIHASPG